jgi:hypothetical protein
MLSGKAKIFFGVVKETRDTTTNATTDLLLALGLYFLASLTMIVRSLQMIRGFALGK